VESSHHLFFECDKTLQICNGILAWLGIRSVMHTDSNSHYLKFLGLFNESRKRTPHWQSIWFVIFWEIWLWQNKVIFSDITWEFNQIFDLVLAHSWLWSKASNRLFHYSIRDWILNIPSCVV
jgi:hypothetical protein